MVAGNDEVVPMLALLSRRDFVAAAVAWTRVREGALSFEDGFHISGVGLGGDPKLADLSRPLLRRDQLPVLEYGRGSRSSRDIRVGGESSGIGSTRIVDGLRIPEVVEG